MQISSNPTYQPPASPAVPHHHGHSVHAARAETTSTASAAPKTAAPSASAALQKSLDTLPNTRADVVARGKTLAADSTYPPLEIINKLANLFVADTRAASKSGN